MSTSDPLRDFLEGLLPGNPLIGEPPIPRFLIPRQEQLEGKPQELMEPLSPLTKPGCVAAENTILVLGLLDGLAEGMGGFAVLRQGKERLEEAAHGARLMKDDTIAGRLVSIADLLPDVHTEEEAKAAAELLRPLKALTWVMGKRCKGALTLEQMTKAKDLAAKVRAGKTTLAQAIQEVRGA